MADRAPDCTAPHWPRRLRAIALAGLLAAAAAAAGAQPMFGIVDGPLNLLADVTEATSTRGIVFSDNQRVLGTISGPKQTAEYLYLVPPPTLNRSGRGPGPQRGFASSLAESDGNGGVGASAFYFGRPAGTGTAGYGELASQAVWTQTFEHTGGPASATDISLHLEIPAVEVALHGVGPRRSAVSETETAQAIATVSTLDAGDRLTYIYALAAIGTTNGGERGFHAFVGDPFGVNIVGGNLRPTVTLAVHGPQGVASWLLGLGWLGWQRFVRQPNVARITS